MIMNSYLQIITLGDRETWSSRQHLPVSFKPWPGLQIYCTCRLWLVRDTRRGEKAHDQQRRRERYHQQRPGDL